MKQQIYGKFICNINLLVYSFLLVLNIFFSLTIKINIHITHNPNQKCSTVEHHFAWKTTKLAERYNNMLLTATNTLMMYSKAYKYLSGYFSSQCSLPLNVPSSIHSFLYSYYRVYK